MVQSVMYRIYYQHLDRLFIHNRNATEKSREPPSEQIYKQLLLVLLPATITMTTTLYTFFPVTNVE